MPGRSKLSPYPPPGRTHTMRALIANAFRVSRRFAIGMRSKPFHTGIALLVVAGGITSAVIAGTSNASYTGCGYGYAGYGNPHVFGYGTCPPTPPPPQSEVG